MSRAPLVQFEHVGLDLAGTPVLRDLDWELARGERWGVVGANGSGKTSFLSLIAGTLWPAPGHGVRTYDFGKGEQRDAVQARAEIVLIGHELQDRYARWGWNFTALEVVLSGVYRTDVPRRQPDSAERERALTTMRRLDVERLANRRFLELSRGEQRRVLIARGVAFEPTVLLLDEPASGLDQPARAELAAMLERIAEQLTLVCTAHVADDVPPTIDRLLFLARGRITASERRGDTSDHTTTRAAPAAASHAAPPIASGAASTATDPVAVDALPLIELDNADVWLGARHVLQAIDWRLDSGQQWLVTGANGSGKSTFLRLLHGQLRPALGSEVRWPALGDPRNVWTLRRRIAWVSPELQANYRYPTNVRACIASGFESSVGQTRGLTADEEHRVDALLAQFELLPLEARPLSALSYGQARRALIARALANRPRVLLLDEPWEGLDAEMSALLNATLQRVIADGTQLVCASHLAAHRELFTHELALEHGRIVRSGARSAAA